MRKIITITIILSTLLVITAGCRPVATTEDEVPPVQNQPVEATPTSPPYAILVPSPTNWVPIADGNQQTSFTLPVNGICRITVYSEIGNIINYSWKADDALAAWYLTPGGVATINGIEGEITPAVYDDNMISGYDWSYSYTDGNTSRIVVTPYTNGPGYYTFCFYNGYEGASTINVLFSYRVN
jgi:hypothetical protein